MFADIRRLVGLEACTVYESDGVGGLVTHGSCPYSDTLVHVCQGTYFDMHQARELYAPHAGETSG